MAADRRLRLDFDFDLDLDLDFEVDVEVGGGRSDRPRGDDREEGTDGDDPPRW